VDYRAVGTRCAVKKTTLDKVGPQEEWKNVLATKGFNQIVVDASEIARSVIGKAYRRGARSDEAPTTFDCSSLIKWIYGQCGVWLPRRTIQQREYGEPVELSRLQNGDVVFTSGQINYYFDDPADGVGHVGIYTGNGHVIHAANRRVGVVESTLDSFTNGRNFRGSRRYLPTDGSVIVLETPPHREVETEDDILWILRQ
jgi:cell wall-associated NlpC family hydrolase